MILASGRTSPGRTLLLCLSLVFCFPAYDCLRHRYAIARGESATARIAEKYVGRSAYLPDFRSEHYLRFSFQESSGAMSAGRQPVGAGLFERTQVGQPVKIHYLTGHNLVLGRNNFSLVFSLGREAVLDDDEDYYLWSALRGAGSIGLVLAVFFAFSAWRSKRSAGCAAER